MAEEVTFLDMTTKSKNLTQKIVVIINFKKKNFQFHEIF